MRFKTVQRTALTLMTVVLLLGSSGCSVRKIAYGWINRILVNRFVDTFDLDAKQKRDLVPRVTALHEWHRKNELPRYVELIDGLMSRLENGLDRQEVEWLIAQSNTAVERLSNQFSPQAAAVIATLSDQQIEHAVEEFKKGARERFEKLEQSDEDYVKFRLSRARKNLKTWFGSYTDAQLQEFERFVRKNRVEEQRRRKRYEENREALFKAMRAHAGPQALQSLIHRWITRQEVEDTPEFQRAEDRMQREFIDLTLAIDRLMTPEQRRHLLSELRSWRTDFYELANGI